MNYSGVILARLLRQVTYVPDSAAEGRLVNAKNGLPWGKTATLAISTKLTNHGHKRGHIQVLG